LVYIYLHSGPRCNSIGAYQIKPGQISLDVPDVTDADEVLDELKNSELIDREGRVIRIVKFLKHSPIMNWQHAVRASEDCIALPDTGIRNAVAVELWNSVGMQKLREWRDKSGKVHKALIRFGDQFP